MFQINDWITGLDWLRFFRIAGFIICISFFYYRLIKENIKIHPIYPVLLLGVFYIAIFLGSRLFSLLESAIVDQIEFNWYALLNSPNQGLMRWYGGMLALVLSISLVKLLLPSKTTWQLMDIYALGICISIAIVVQGCQFSGDGCYGIPTTLPWGMHYAYGTVPSILPVHPTPIYNSIFHLVLFVLLLRIRKKLSPGETTILFFTASSIFCFLLEFIRNNDVVTMGLTLGQVTYATIILITILSYIMVHQTKRTKPFVVPMRNLQLTQIQKN